MNFNKITAILIAVITLTLISAYTLPTAFSNGAIAIKAIGDSTVTDSTKVTYTCPMHPEVTSDQPGTCPKCGMDLVPKKSDTKEEGLNTCPDIEKCREKGCDMNDCKGQAGGCMNNCPMIKEHKDHNKPKEHDHNSKDNNDNSGGHKHKGC